MEIQWYPGHMTKSMRMMQENINLVDVVIEILDARIPDSSKNPDIDNLSKNKRRIIILNKSDMADKNITDEWEDYYKNKGFKVIKADSITGKGINAVYTSALDLMKDKIENQKKRGRIFVPVRAMVVGIPNVGKSTFINKIIGKKSAATGNKPGVTRGKQWIKVKNNFELLDTPGILWHKFDNMEAGIKLAITGAIKDEIVDMTQLAIEFITIVKSINPNIIKDRYNLDFENTIDNYALLESIGNIRGFKKKGGQIDIERTANTLIDEFRSLKLGNISLERPIKT